MRPVLFTLVQLVWAVWWGALHVRIRRRRAYAAGRTAASTDRLYKLANPLLYLVQNGLCIASFWSSAPWLLKVWDNDGARAAGVAMLAGGSLLYAWALAHLGAHYSPCYDTHLPSALVQSGPYRVIRHPMYAAKLILGAAPVVSSGSLWFLPTTLYFYAATLRAVVREDRQLAAGLVGYEGYRERSWLLVPGVV